VETRRITTVSELLEYAEFINRALERIKEKNHETIPTAKSFSVLRARISNPEFAVWIQLNGIVPVGLCACVVVEDLFFELVGFAWLMTCFPGASYKDFDNVMTDWFKRMGVTKLQACSLNYSKAKERWLTRHGYELLCHNYERKLCQNG
jgi:hypothetical protein